MEQSKHRRVLGIDTGTNSLGWAIVNYDESGYCTLVEHGVDIFQEGVKEEKGIESSKAAERTVHKHQRVQYYRRKLRKIQLLKVLTDNGMCPPLTPDGLRQWRLKKIYPHDERFMRWQRTDDNISANPYYFRHLCLTEKLDFGNEQHRFIIGRALYHINQRRGFLSNRKEQTDDDETGTVKKAIGALSDAMKEADCQYLGEYFYQCYQTHTKIRNQYTARLEHYLTEFKAICAKQELPEELCKALEKAIFTQRPLKSQKLTVGHCVFEKNKSRCPTSRPEFEEYRMLQLINNIQVEGKQINAEARLAAQECFYVKDKSIKFDKIARRLRKIEQYKYAEFDYDDEFPIASCPVTHQLRVVFGSDWRKGICEAYKLKKDKNQMVDDVWHALFSSTDSEHLEQFARKHLSLDEDKINAFAKIHVPQDYARLSLKAINKILPFLRKGFIYSYAVFLANLEAVLPEKMRNADERESIEAGVVNCIEQFPIILDNWENLKDKKGTTRPSIYDAIQKYLIETHGASPENVKKLYHPSMVEAYPEAHGEFLGSPRNNSVRNPMAMRSLFQLRKLVNRLIKEKKIDKDTVINIEFARELNDANKRKAIHDINREKEKERAAAGIAIREAYKKETGRDIEPTDKEILRYQLWEEQGHLCLYTGREINITQVVGGNTEFDIEHTIPRSRGGDSTKMNLTLCESRYNREVKKTKLPTELDNSYDILQRIESWREKCEAIEKQINKNKQASRGISTKEKHDKNIQQRRKLEYLRDYWKSKYEHFIVEQKDLDKGFTRRQGTDISVISRYARLYLKSYFPKVYIVKGIATAQLRKIWGLQDEYEQKSRDNHVHHCIDAIVIACIGADQYNQLASYYHREEEHKWYNHAKPHFPKPWPTFTEDVKTVEDEILISHYTPDNMPKKARRRILVKGGKKQLNTGDSARGSLHNDTYYGAIAKPDSGEIKYVVSKALASMQESDVKNIVDETVKSIVQKAIDEKGFKEAMNGKIWMNEEKGIEIKKVRCYTPTVTNPLNIRQYRDLSKKEYKQQFHVANDRNYMMAIYIGHDKQGREKRDFELVNYLQAAAYFKRSADQTVAQSLVPLKSKRDFPLAYTLKIGTMVLLYENSPKEIYDSYDHWQTATDSKERRISAKDVVRRLYKIRGMSSMTVQGNTYGTIEMIFHEESRKSTELKAKNGAFKQNEEHRPVIKMLHTQIRALVEGYDFTLNELGEVKFLNRPAND